MIPTLRITLSLCSFLLLLISSSTAKTSSFRPKAIVLPVTKDISTSTPQYVTQIKQRTPLVTVNLTVDLGGGYVWVNCEHGYVSSTSKAVACGSAQCKLFGSSSCSSDKVCGGFPSNTVTGVSTSGDVRSDVVSVQSTNGNYSGRAVTVPKFLFICGSDVVQKGLPKGVSGIAGFGRTKVSLPFQFSSAFHFTRKFAICLSSGTIDSRGVIIIGDAPYNFGYLNSDLSKALNFTPLIKNPVSTAPISSLGEPSFEYFIGVKSINISDKEVPLNKTLLSINKNNGVGGTKISTVNPYGILETSIYKALSKAFVSAVGVQTISPVSPFGTCFASHDIGFTPMGPGVPDIKLVLENGAVWDIIGANSMVSLNNSDVLCLGFVDGGSNPKTSQVGFYHKTGNQPTTSITIGALQLENNLIQVDLKTSRLGFRSIFLDHSNCANFNFTSSV
ncbi:hypothetical protein PIB30_008680 [Stylosanthes scabra]|uniref:Peptidase A1 domain-containing protein n=1 Tax=Stylosanthes scabra TaxID=79078 RepID=A0ABU6T716_9FABA|nr:hypothetical protein [Stylosanthes scabra]